MKLGFLGLGNLGRAVAGRLLDSGYDLAVWNRTPGREGEMAVEVLASPAAVRECCDIIFCCLFDSNAVNSVLTGERGLLGGDMGGKIVVDLTTNHFQQVLEFHELCAAAGGIYMEAPVLGSVVPASKGVLTVLVSGSNDGYRQVRSVLDKIGQHIFFLEKPGLATRMKLVNNLTLASFMATIAEALAMAEGIGMDRQKVLEILAVGGGKSLVLDAKKDKLLREDFAPHFSCRLIHKDLHCLQDLAFEEKRSLFTAAVVKELYARTFEEGIADLDFSAIYQLFTER